MGEIIHTGDMGRFMDGRGGLFQLVKEKGKKEKPGTLNNKYGTFLTVVLSFAATIWRVISFFWLGGRFRNALVQYFVPGERHKLRGEVGRGFCGKWGASIGRRQ